LIAAGALLLVFALVVAVLQPRHQDMECSCFGAVASSRISKSLVARDAVAALAAIAVAIAAWTLDVPRLAAADFLVLLVLGSMLLVGAEFRRFVHIKDRRLEA
jgi:hypothetical protein